MTVRSRLALFAWIAAALLAVAFAGVPARADTEIYGINLNGIYQLDSATSVSTAVWTGAPFPYASTAVGPAAIAECTDGTIWFTDRTANPATLYRFNPQTPAVAPVAIGTTTGTADTLLRMTCHPTTGVLYAMTTSPNTIYTLNKSTGAATGTALTLPATTLPIAGSGDFAFDSGGTLYYIGESDTPAGGGAASVRLWTINLGTNTYANVGALTGLPDVANGIAFTQGDGLRITSTNATRMYTASVLGGAATGVGANGAMPAMTDLSSIIVTNPNLSITKTANVSGISPSTATPVTYTITVTNNSSYAVTGTVTDTFPAGESSISWTCAASGGSTCGAASGTGNINTTAQLAVSGTATYTVTVTANSASAIINTASVALPFGFLTDSNPADNTASHTLYLRPTVTKAFSPTTIPVGGTTQVTLTLGNANTSALTLSSAFTDTLPTGFVVATPNGLAGTCTSGSVTATPGTNAITYASGATLPASGGCTIIVNVANTADTDANIANAAGFYTNTVAAGALATSGGTNSAAASANLSVLGGYKSVRLLTDTDGSGGVTPGDVLQWSVFFYNPPNGAAAGTTVAAFQATDAIGANLTYVAGSLTLTKTPNSCNGARNASFNGAGNTNLLNATVSLAAPANTGCTLRFDYNTTINAGSGGLTVSNQASGSGTGLAAVATDNIDTSTTGDPANVAPTAGSIAQTQLSGVISPTTVLVGGGPSLTVVKSSIAFSDPYNNTTNPKRIPGGFVTYSVVTTNSGAGAVDNNTTVLVDSIPANTALYVGNVGGAGSGPVAFTNGSPTSGLTYTFTSLASTTDDVSFSNDGGVTFNYTPVADANGVDANVTHIRINPKGVFAGDSVAGPPSPNWTVSFRVRVK